MLRSPWRPPVTTVPCFLRAGGPLSRVSVATATCPRLLLLPAHTSCLDTCGRLPPPAACIACRLFNELAASPELRMDYYLQPGDIEIVSNHTALHTRTEFVDHEVSEAAAVTFWPCIRALYNARAFFTCSLQARISPVDLIMHSYLPSASGLLIHCLLVVVHCQLDVEFTVCC